MISWKDSVSINNKCDYYAYENLQEIKLRNEELKILHLNLRGWESKLNELNTLLNAFYKIGHEIYILLFGETFMTKRNKSKCIINGYTLKEYAIGESSQHGGVSIYTKNDIHCFNRPDLKVFKEWVFESCFIEVVTSYNVKNTIVGEIYRVPNTKVKNFIDDFESII